jgi:hypothetical protein
VPGTYDVYGGNNRTALREATQVPVNDPAPLVSTMAPVTEHLGFGLTCTRMDFVYKLWEQSREDGVVLVQAR